MKDDDTPGGHAPKHYGPATEPSWRAILEANQGATGQNPDIICAGIVLTMPELPPALKTQPRKPPRHVRASVGWARVANRDPATIIALPAPHGRASSPWFPTAPHEGYDAAVRRAAPS